jgi:hypothetical protein
MYGLEITVFFMLWRGKAMKSYPAHGQQSKGA